MEDNNTNKKILVKGLKQLGICLFLMFSGPTLLHLALNNKEKTLYIPLVIFSIILCISAIVLLFVGIITIMNSIFNNKPKH